MIPASCSEFTRMIAEEAMTKYKSIDKFIIHLTMIYVDWRIQHFMKILWYLTYRHT